MEEVIGKLFPTLIKKLYVQIKLSSVQSIHVMTPCF